MIRLIIFDFDDTIISLNVRWNDVKSKVIEFAKSEGLTVNENEYLPLISILVSNTPKRKAIIDDIYRRYEEECVKKKAYTIFPAMLELIKDLKAQGYLLAIASGNHSETIRGILGQINILNNFDFICGREMVLKNKPHAEQLEHIMSMFGVRKDETLFVGNSRWDALAGEKAGVKTIIIKDGDVQNILDVLKPNFKKLNK